MELFKYMKYRDDFFRERLIRFSPFNVLNDPFEAKISETSVLQADAWKKGAIRAKDENGDIVTISPEAATKKLIQLFGDFDKKLGVFSLSASKHSLLMWAHYADSHRGILVGFDSGHPFFHQDRKYSKQGVGMLLGTILPVTYERVRCEFCDVLKRHLLKSDEWMYEKEFRMFMFREDCDVRVKDLDGSELDLVQVPEEAITRIIIGSNADCVQIIKHFKEALAFNPKLKHITIELAKPHADLFHITFEKVDAF